MNHKQFEDKYKELISDAPFKEIIDLFEEKKKGYKDNKLILWIKKIKDKLLKEKTAHFLELGYSIFESIEFTETIFRLALQHQRGDVVEYMFKEKYISSMGEGFYLNQIVASKKVLQHILSIKNITEKITPYEYGKMLESCVMNNMTESFDMVCQSNPEKIKEIKQEQQNRMLLSCARFNAQKMLDKLLHMKEPFEFDIDAKDEDPYLPIHARDNLLIYAAKNNNIPMMRYLLTSPELEKHADLSESFWWIIRLTNGKEIMDNIIFDIKAPLTENLQMLLEGKQAFTPYLELFTKRNIRMKIEENLPIKNQKTKLKKI